MKTGDSIKIKATVLRVEGKRLDAQTADGQLIQTDVSNVMTEEKEPTATPNAKTPEKKSVPPAENKRDGRAAEHKAILNAPENKSGK